jgi:hypothetical protein
MGRAAGQLRWIVPVRSGSIPVMKAFRLDVQLCMASQSMKSPPWSANRFMASLRKAGLDNPGAEARVVSFRSDRLHRELIAGRPLGLSTGSARRRSAGAERGAQDTGTMTRTAGCVTAASSTG